MRSRLARSVNSCAHGVHVLGTFRHEVVDYLLLLPYILQIFSMCHQNTSYDRLRFLDPTRTSGVSACPLPWASPGPEIAGSLNVIGLYIRYQQLTCACLSSSSILELINQETTTIELAKSAGFPVEEHRTVTEDGYLIVLHRIPPLASIREQRVVIYIHGLFASSLDMVIRGRKMGFGYQLSEAGFDVWLPNLRGSTDNPITVNVTKNNPWDFSWDENARYDFPAIMDYVLATTGTRKVSTIGMSMAANVVLGGVALRPQYNQRLGCMVFFAPTARMKYTTSFVRFAAPHWQWFQKIAEIYRIYKIPNMNNELFHRLMSWLCSLRNVGLFFCTSIIFSAESNIFQIEKELVPTLFKYYPHPGSTKTVIHYFQMANSGRFCAFDYGPEQNVVKYNQTVPMGYDLSKVTAPAAIFYSKWDSMVNYQNAATALHDSGLDNISSIRVSGQTRPTAASSSLLSVSHLLHLKKVCRASSESESPYWHSGLEIFPILLSNTETISDQRKETPKSKFLAFLEKAFII
ncbi:hypothetical protein J6590_020958 [Homalodisca vitripennis]|nr:hypothetical protein J6590_020958 [Homalodisca vitripennis]